MGCANILCVGGGGGVELGVCVEGWGGGGDGVSLCV